MPIPREIEWAQKLQAIAQTGLNYNPPPFDRERYEYIREIAAEMLASNSNGTADLDTIRALFDAQTGHATPKIDVRGVVFRDDKILLVQEKLDNYRWTLPGGWADVGEPPGEATAREIEEESGYSTRPVKLLALYDCRKHDHPPFPFHAYKAFFRCELIDPERHVDPARDLARFAETGEVGWFAADAIPELSVARVTYAQIARFFLHLRQPDLPTDFD